MKMTLHRHHWSPEFQTPQKWRCEACGKEIMAWGRIGLLFKHAKSCGGMKFERINVVQTSEVPPPAFTGQQLADELRRYDELEAQAS